MQTTLMGLAIALILALVAALVGPYFVDWNGYRGSFEAEASRIVGLNVRVAGDIDVRLLPTPSVRLAEIEIGPKGHASRLRARSLGIEFGLGPLLRGELRAVKMRLEGPEVSVGLNSLGQVDWPAMALSTETLSIDRLNIDGGRIVLTDALSGARIEIEKLNFTGSVRSLTGPFHGSGSFSAAGAVYAYRIAAGRAGADGTRVTLAIDDSERPLNAEFEGLLTFARNAPQFDGSLKLFRPAGAVQASGRVIAQEPWKLTGRVTATSQMALVEQLVFQYGPDERAATLSGTAEFRFGEHPRLESALAARQIDLDRLIATPELPRRPPLAAFQNFAELFSAALKPAVPSSVTISVDAVTLGGAVLQNVGADLRTDGSAWRLDKLEFRGPGFAQVKLSGRLDRSADGLGFAGALGVDANDPRALIAWLAGRNGLPAQIKPLRLRGELALGAGRIALDKLQASFDRGTIAGRLAYWWPNAAHPARLDAELTAGELDLDALLKSGTSALAGLSLEWPREVALGLDIERAQIAGFEARKVQTRLKFDAQGIAIERLSVADFGNATIDASGRLITTANPGGNITVDLDARDLGGVMALAERFAPTLAGPLRRLAATQNSAKLRLTLGLENTGRGSATGKLAIAGRIGVFRFDVTAGATGKPSDFILTDLPAMALTDVRVEAGLQSDDGNALLTLIGFDRLATPDARPARLSFAATGPLRRQWHIDGALAAGPIDAKAKGAIRLQRGTPVTVAFDRLSGTIGGSPMRGKLALTFADAPTIEGSIETDALDVPAAIATALGMPRHAAERPATLWPAEPFVPSNSDLTGRVEVKALRATITPTLTARQFRGVLRFGPSQFVFEDVAGELAGGRLDGRLALAADRDGITARARIAVTGADASAFSAAAASGPMIGRLSLQTEITAAGLSPAAFMGSIAGTGSITLENAQLAGLNPRVFDAVIRAVDLGIPTGADRIRDFVTSSLDTGSLPVKRAEAAIAIKNGRARIADLALRSGKTELSVTANVDLVNAELDAVMTLSGQPADGDTIRPTVFVMLKGPLFKPKRSVAADALATWLALRAVEQQSKRLDAVERPATATPQAQPAPDITSALPAPAVRPPAPEIDVDAISPAERAPPLPPAITILPAPRPRADSLIGPLLRKSSPRPAKQKAAPGRPLDLLGAQR